MRGAVQMQVTTIGLDIAKNVFQVHGIDANEKVVVRKISLLRWRSGGLKHPHDMPPSRFAPSPTSGDSSANGGQGRRSESLAADLENKNANVPIERASVGDRMPAAITLR